MGEDSSKKKVAAPPTSPPLMEPDSSLKKPSLINVLLLYITLLGLGGIIGYGAFSYLAASRCETLLDDIERRHLSGGGGASASSSRNKPVAAVHHHHDDEENELKVLQTSIQTRQLWQTIERYVFPFGL